MTEQTIGRDYDHYDPEFALDPHERYAELRAKCPVPHSENYGGYYVLTKFQDAQEAMQNPEIFSSWPADTPATPGHTIDKRLIPLEVDPPDHRRYRKIAEPIFRPQQIKSIEDSVRTYARELVDAMVTKREFDFIEEFAKPFPGAVFLRLIGLDFDAEQRDTLIEWSDTILHTTTTEGVEHGDAEAQAAARLHAGRELHRFLRGILQARIEEPGDDILSLFLDAEYGGERMLSHTEILNFAYVIVLAGLDTVTTALGFSFLHLGRRPDLQDRIAGDPALIPTAVEEMLRYEAIVHASRTVTEPYTLSGVELKPGDRITLPLASIHRDDDAFERADEIVLDRKPNRHLAFGGGDHRCLGSHLARMEMRIAFEEIFKQIPQFSIPEDAQIRAYGGQTRSLVTVPFRTWR